MSKFVSIVLICIFACTENHVYMASVKFYLNEPKSTSSTIFFRLNYGAYKIEKGKKKYLPLQYHVDEKLNPAFWNKEKGKVRETKAFPQHPEFNTRLNNIRDTVLDILRRLKNDGISPTHEILKKEFNLIFKKGKNQSEESDNELMTFIPYFIKTCNWSIGTKKSYKIVYDNLREFEQSKKLKLTYSKITIDFYNEFIDFLQSKAYTPNTIATRIKVLKTFMNEAHERGYHNNLDYKKKSFNKPSDKTKKVYLTENELQTIYKLDLSNNKKLDLVRDWFLIGAYTGLRFSDLEQLAETDFKEKTIEIKTKKTGNEVVVPLNKIVRQILRKHKNKIPKIISNQKFNEYIKDVVEKAGIVYDIVIHETKGKTDIKKIEKKYNLVSAHTARRSFATNAYLAGVPTIQIMKMTGHETEEAFLSYIRISKQENAEKLLSHPFFN